MAAGEKTRKQTSAIIDVRIELPSGDTHLYVPEADRPAVRLRQTLRTQIAYPAEWAVVPGTLTSDGQPLGALLLSDLPCSPGVLARARLLGMLIAGPDRYLVAVLADDPKQDGLVDIGDLADEAKDRICALLQAPESPAPLDTSWLGPDEAVHAVQEARRAARLAQAEYHAARSRPPAWHALGSRFAADTATYSESETLLYRLPYRFQQYVARLLVPEERILAFAPRPRGTGDGLRLFGKRERAEAGIVVLTDHQVLWLEDLPGSPLDVEAYGYSAQSVPLERLVSASVTTSGRAAVLQLVWQAAGGGRWAMAVRFPSVSFGLASEIAAIARRFVDAKGQDALMRLASPPEDRSEWQSLIEADDQTTGQAAQRWREWVPNLLRPEEKVVAKAVIPGWFSADGQPAAWLATTDRLVVLPADPASQAYRFWEAGHIGSVRLVDSVFESSIAFEWLEDGQTNQERFVFPLVAAAQFVQLFVALRRIMVGRAGFAVHAAPTAIDEPQ